jgi:hydroxymethylpyrimidine pyrophosphatase-like HAD family hydrolase
VLTVIVIITGRSICGINSYCDNTDNKGRFICSVNSYCDNNREVYVQC